MTTAAAQPPTSEPSTANSVDPQALLDTREGPAFERWGETQIVAARPILLRVLQRSGALPAPPADSWLGRVDAKSEPFQTSEQVRVFAQVAADNLREVNLTLRSRVPMFALYSLVRSAMEASSLGLWILDARSEDLAASRTLRVYRQNIASDRTLWRTVVGRDSGDHEQLATKAETVHRALRGIDHSNFYDAVQSTAVIQSVDRNHPCESSGLDVFGGLEVWRLCSAVSHANQVSLLNILERHPEGPLGEPTRRTSRTSFVAAVHSTAVHRANLLIDTFTRRSHPRRSGR